MALINCPNCGKEISDKAILCPSCGYELKKEIEDEIEKRTKKCEDCGSELPEDAIICPICGCPVQQKISQEETSQKVEVTKVSFPKIDKKKRNTIIGIILIIIITVAIVMGINQQNAKTYKNNLELASITMLSGASTAEDAGKLVHDVWYNTIYEEKDSSTDKYTRKNNGSSYFYDDFNDSLSVLFTDTNFQKKIDSIKENQDTVKTLMKELINPTEEYQEAYNELKEYYDAYLDLTNIAIDPSGNLQSYTSNFNNADSEILKCHKAMQLYLE